MTGKTILLADDDAAIRTVLNQALTRAGYTVMPTGNATTMWNWVERGEGDVLITDVSMPDGNAFDMMPGISKKRPDLPIIVMSAQNTFMTAIRASELGAYDYLPKPFDLNELVSLVGRACSEAATAQMDARIPDEPDSDQIPLIGRSPAMQEIYRVLARLMQTDLTVMITGESGTGKELVARALHDFGKRAKGPFVAINMAAIPRDLIEAELFGHEKGAFTGATQRASGQFELAEGGTLFLDEIGDMPMEAQTRLLRVLQQGEYTTVGGRRPIRTDVRIVAATHRDLTTLISQGQFREDLFYRLNVVPMRLPPLRERLDDIPDLVRHFFKVSADEDGPVKQLSAEAMRFLQGQRWPGNVRELENLVRRVCALYADETISLELLQQELVSVSSVRPSNNDLAVAQNLAQAIETHMAREFAGYAPDLPPPGLYQRIIDEVEVPLLNATLQAVKGNQIKAAELLGLNRNTLRKKIRAHDIEIVRGVN